MYFTTIVNLLLLSCLSAAGTSLHRVSEEPQQEEGVKAVTVIVITKIRLDVTATNATLQFCAEDDLPPGKPWLTYRDLLPGSDQASVDGSRDVDDNTCAIFVMDPSFTLPDFATRYEFLVIDPDTSDGGRCVSTFAMTVKTILLTCGTERITKVTWSDLTPVESQLECVAMDAALADEAVCYRRGDVWTKDFCFNIEDQEGATITICMTGFSSPIPGKGTVSERYFYYGPDAVNNGPGKATLSLRISDPVGSEIHSRAIVRPVDSAGVPGDATVYDCPNNECTLNFYARIFANYEVCVEVLQYTTTKATAMIKFTDLNLNVFGSDSQTNTSMTFVFANGLPGMRYSASFSTTEPSAGSLGPSESNTADLDCTNMAPGDPCIGNLDIGTNERTVYLAISDPSGSNTIVTPYVIK